jgi:hypothetical protein
MGKHRDRMAQDLALRGVAKTTAEVYLKYARKFVAHFGRTRPVDCVGAKSALSR